MADPPAREEARRLVEHMLGRMVASSDLAAALHRLLLRGDVVAVRQRPAARRLDAPKVVDLRDVRPIEPVVPLTSPTWIEVRVVAEGGLSVTGTEAELRLVGGERRSLVLDASGMIRVDDVEGDGRCSLEIVGPAELGPGEGTGDGYANASASVSAAEGGQVGLATGQSHTVVLRQPSARIVELGDACFDTAGAVFRPEASISEGGDEPIVSGLLGIGRALEAARHEPLRWWVVGHADTVGSDEANLVLSQERATNVYLLLSGDVEGWATHCEVHATVADVQAAYRWVARRHGWDCDPGPVDGDLGEQTRSARDRFRQRYNTERSGTLASGAKQGHADWVALHDMYSIGLSEQLDLPPEELDSLRQGLEWIEPCAVGAGEAFPIEAPDKDDFASLANRRVDLIAFSEAESHYVRTPADPAHVYGEARVFRRTKLVPPSDDPAIGTLTWITIAVVQSGDGEPIAGRAVRLNLPGDERIRTTGEDGRVTFVGVPAGALLSASVLRETAATMEDEASVDGEDQLEEQIDEAPDDDDVPAPPEPTPPEPREEGEHPDAMEVDDDDLEDD